MKYFTSDLWIKLNSSDEKERISAEKLWDENNKIYNDYFTQSEKLLPKRFIQLYIKHYGFHDYLIKYINMKLS